ncbi:MAG: dTDP-4-dehydrorhamnose 3,5-epimerase [Acidobacteria bacterium]|nr:dTDP-4-dehydrorhamnose 3,5-epimerase [Acidobacteriota bacterium]
MSARAIATDLSGVLIIEPIVHRDARGFFFESYNERTFTRLGIADRFIQDNHSRSERGVLRGIHYQDLRAPLGKLVRCTRGAILDVAVDLRVQSPTFGHHVAVELTEDNARQLWVPVGFGHGFATLSEIAEVQYKCTGFYVPECEGAIRWNDPELAIGWPFTEPTLSARDATSSSFADYRTRPAFR